MKIILDLEENVLLKLKEQAKSEGRSRKNQMERILIKESGWVSEKIESAIKSVTETPVIRNQKIKISYETFVKMIADGGCEDPEDHRIFIETVKKSDNLTDRQKESLITASRNNH